VTELQPEDVFTPARPVREDMFATRRHKRLQERVEADLLEQGRQIIVYGPTGVGKTSLINYICGQRNVPMVRVECGGTFEEMMRDALAKTLEEEEVERVVTVGGEAELSASLWKFLSGKVKGSAERQVKKVKLPRSLGGLVAEALALSDMKVLFLDNFENLHGKRHGKATARAVAELLKLFSDRSAEADVDVKVVVARSPRRRRN
jgi:ABC-type hemin transport system ATPase subunit